MFARMVIIKSTGQEQIQVDMPSWNPVTGQELDVTPSDMKEQLSEMLSILDERVNENYIQLLKDYNILRYFSPEIQAKLIQVIDMLTGNADPALVIQRWDAEIEENAALEEGRRLAAERQAVQQDSQLDMIDTSAALERGW